MHVSNFKIFYFLYRTLRYVPESSQDKIIPDEDVFETLLKTFKALFINDFSRQADILALLPELKCQYLELLTVGQKQLKANPCNHQGQHVFTPEEVLFNTLGFTVSRDQSSLVSAGTGVFVTKGFVPKGAVVSMYPGNRMFLFLVKLNGISNRLIMKCEIPTLIFVLWVCFLYFLIKITIYFGNTKDNSEKDNFVYKKILVLKT